VLNAEERFLWNQIIGQPKAGRYLISRSAAGA
jgi:hypothetical protein